MEKILDVARIYKENRTRLKMGRVNGDIGHDRQVTSSKLNRPGLELGGFWGSFDPHRIQIIGQGESKFLKTQSAEQLKVIFNKLLHPELPLVIFAHGAKPPECAIELARERKIAILTSGVVTTYLVAYLLDYLDWELAPSTIVHGSLVDVYGVGLLFTGRSGIGKSEIALDLVERGHRLVADDVVKIIRRADNVVIGTGVEMLEHHLELRGLGIVDVRHIFGIRAVRQQKRIEVQVELQDWDSIQDYERIGNRNTTVDILGVAIPLIKLPINPGKNITVIAEVIALNHIMKYMGKNAALEFERKLAARIRLKTRINELQRYLKKDFE